MWLDDLNNDIYIQYNTGDFFGCKYVIKLLHKKTNQKENKIVEICNIISPFLILENGTYRFPLSLDFSAHSFC